METEKENADGVTVLPLLLETGTCPAAAVLRRQLPDIHLLVE